MTYSSSIRIGRQPVVARNQNTTSFRKNEARLGPVSNTVILVVLACLVGLLYLTQVTKTNTFTYRINDLKLEQNSLRADYDQLVIDSARLQSVERIKTSEAASKLVSVSPSATIQN